MPSEQLCIECGREGVPVYAKGLCRRDYKRDLKERHERVAMADTEVFSEGGDGGGESNPVAAFLDDVQALQQEQVLDEPLMTQGEQRPGGVGTPSSPRVAADPEEPAKGPRSWFKKKPKVEVTGPAPTTREKRPGASRGGGRRTSAADTLSDGWGLLGGALARSPRHAPLGRYMMWSGPVTGELLDDAVKGTVVDKLVLQRVVSARGRFDTLGAVFGPPMLILAIERNPQRADVLFPMLKASIRQALPQMVPAIKKARDKEAKIAKATEELFADDPAFQGIEGDPVDYILSMMFDGWIPPQPVPEAPVEETEEAVA